MARFHIEVQRADGACESLAETFGHRVDGLARLIGLQCEDDIEAADLVTDAGVAARSFGRIASQPGELVIAQRRPPAVA